LFNNTCDRLRAPCQNTIRFVPHVVEPERILACNPLASSSNPNARTMARVGLKPFSSNVSTDDLFDINTVSAVGEDRNHIQYPN